MDTTKYIESLVKQKYKSVMEFARVLDIPYTTIRSAFEKGIEGTAVSTVLKICKELNISADLLFDNKVELFYTSSQEQKIIQDLRKLPPKELDKVLAVIEFKLYELNLGFSNQSKTEYSNELRIY
jgi:hypothetical protein